MLTLERLKALKKIIKIEALCRKAAVSFSLLITTAMQKYDTKKMVELTGCSEALLSNYKNGVKNRRNGRVEWTASPLLDASDYETIIENGRAKTYYFDSAIEKIRAKREKGKSLKPS